MRIYTLTPNPALDLSGHVTSLIPNEKNYVKDARKDPGGNGINASRVIHKQGFPTTALGFLGGPTGEEIRSLLKREGVPHQFTQIREANRINVTITNDSDHQQTRLTFPGPKIAPVELAALYRQIRKLQPPGLLVIGGSAPGGCPKDFHARLGRIASECGLGVIFDLPGRFYSTLFKKIRFKPLLIKPNRLELEEWNGKGPLRTQKELARSARRLACSASLVCVSLAEEGALLVGRDCIWRGIAPKIKARGTVGAGDSMVGAMASFLLKSGITGPAALKILAAGSLRSFDAFARELLKWGLAAGAATAQERGTAQARPDEIQRLHGKVRVERLTRAC